MGEDEGLSGGKELQKMVAFIMQEAAEKSREVQVKADEEFNIEKAKLVHQETVSIEQQFERRIKQAEVRQKIAQSNQVNKARLRVLQAQDEAVEGMVEEARQRLSQIASSPEYIDIMTSLMLQSFFRFFESSSQLEVNVRVRQSDLPVAREALTKAEAAFQTETGQALTVILDANRFLEESTYGGLVASTMNGRVELSNTLASRLDLVVEAMLPVVRTELFGPSETRRFFD